MSDVDNCSYELFSDITNEEQLDYELQNFHTLFKRLIFIGNSGIGKSTFINMLYNNTIDLDKMLTPARTGNNSSGITDKINAYMNTYDKRLYIDTIGLTDNRLNETQIIIGLKTFLRNIVSGIHLMFIFINYGRIDSKDRKLFQLMCSIFNLNWYFNAAIIVVNTPPGITYSDWVDTLDDDLKYLQKSQEIILSNNMYGTNDIPLFSDIRSKALNDANRCINRSEKLLKPCDNLIEKFKDLLEILIPSVFLPDYRSIFKEMISQTTDNFCCLCKINMYDILFTLDCGHKFHKLCLIGWQQKHDICPKCEVFISITIAKSSYLDNY